MSRIEKAMEKAAFLRRQGDDSAARPRGVDVPQPAAPVASPSPATQEFRAPVSPRYGTLAPDSPYLVSLKDPHCPAAEEFRKLKSVLVKMTTGESFRNSILVTSSVPGEGKSLTAINLAVSLAQELDHTVLLVDADLRRPSVHRYFNVEQGAGLAEILAGEVEIAETIIPTGIGKLSIIRAGRSIDNPAELFGSQRSRGVLAELKNRYPDRYIILDSSPVLSFAEARTLAGQVDGVLFVVMERLASQTNVREALDALKSSPLLGIVYNAATVDETDGRYAYYRESGARRKDSPPVAP
ncbi:XrtA-associated tyrosine autokinase [Geomonas subterranea]|uniref:XrtA-associated tyrosine autokinase n=1 Tax=Geomonas subterranea TaxID=2847989 RepID=A0ABX8LMV9_9BACT|nr:MULTISPECIES: XrtA-associated tyrosine autokinase [Geomonas]QXE91659.1 XrtA-associated tyrosine autokinase [Geomonas subterranea]QXM10247.1 XrtA-associated tyrosine autokinase [Geomonas subterranea]